MEVTIRMSYVLKGLENLVSAQVSPQHNSEKCLKIGHGYTLMRNYMQ